MLTVEEKLKELILHRYHTVSDFGEAAGVPHTTIRSMLERGLMNARIGNVIKICKCLEISADALGDGEIVPRNTLIKEFSPEELELISKYQELDARGKLAVKDTLEREHSYVRPFEEELPTAT